MRALDEGGEPNFNDADYQLAAYAAALKVLTQYGNIDGRDVEHEVFAVRARNEASDFTLQWWGLGSDKSGAMVVEGGYPMATPDQAYASLPYRYERVPP